MPNVEHIFDFLPDSGNFSRVNVTGSQAASESALRVSVRDDLAQLKLQPNVPSYIADLLDLAAALHTVDRVVAPHPRRRRRLQINVPLREPALFCRGEVLSALHDILLWYTEDEWTINFRSRPAGFRQASCGFGHDEREVALWSGGLDSLAGLAGRLRDSPATRFMLVGTGSNKEILGLQRILYQDLCRRLPQDDIALSQVTIHPEGVSSVPGRLNSAPRLRGAVFLLVGAAQALCAGQTTLHVYENGVGAINLPLSGGLAGIDHSRAVHPRSLRLVSRFLTLVADEPIEIVNPFLFATKAKMCRAIRHSGLSDLIKHTISCDTKPRRSYGNVKVRHCGKCTSCLLRRQALAAADIEDDTAYASIVSKASDDDQNLVSLRAMRSQLHQIAHCMQQQEPWEAAIATFPDLTDVLECGHDTSRERAGTVRLYKDYLEEWDCIEPIFE